MILTYSIVSSILLTFGYLAFRFSTEGIGRHRLNRILILLIYASALLIPLIILSDIFHSEPTNAVGVDIEIGNTAVEMTGHENDNISLPMQLLKVIYLVYISGMTIMILYSVFGFLMLWYILRKGEKLEFETFSLVLVDSMKISPFSLHNYIVMSRTDYDEGGDMILLHEYAHIRLNHWVDVALSQAVVCFQWFNPAAWALREELKTIHEYQADEYVLNTGVERSQYQNLLIKRAVDARFHTLVNSLNHSNLKKRITMMYKKKTSLKRQLSALILIPAIAAGCAVTAIPSVAGVLQSLSDSSIASASASAGNGSAPATDKKIYTSVEVQPEFPGGMPALMRFLTYNIRYPEESMKANEQGKVIVKFVVNKDGSVSDPEIVKGVSSALDKESIRVVESMPQWTPGTINGQPVECYFTLPINFRLQDDSPQKDNKEGQ
ncbi:MAG: M56 family metallopeptidase [Muribaculaceae bacterium]|nr:M56 family metallopeptidase [Muribaculaceae bacterium]